MTKNETYAALLAVAIIAYALGARKARTAASAAPYDPLAWLNAYQQ